jgi:hypothetical protein
MSFFSCVRDKLLTIFGDLKVFPYPMFMLYDPGSYAVKGEDVRQLIGVVQEGDILVRGFSRYLDGYFIPGYLSHVGLYLGKVPRQGSSEEIPSQVADIYKEGEQMVVHSMAEGVFMEDLLSFARCDYLVVVRPKITSLPALQFDYKEVYHIALQNLGKPYDFGFNFLVHDSLSCTEFVRDCYDRYQMDLGIFVKSRKFWFLQKSMLIPDDFFTDRSDIAWMSKSVTGENIARIIAKNKLDYLNAPWWTTPAAV